MARFGGRIFRRFKASTRVISGKRPKIRVVTPGIPSRRIRKGRS